MAIAVALLVPAAATVIGLFLLGQGDNEAATEVVAASEDAGPAIADAGVASLAPSVEPVALPIAPTPIEEPEAPSCPDHSGHWSGTWGASTSRGTWTADFTQRPAEGGGTELHGDIRVRGTSCGTGGHIVGRILEDCSVEFDPYRTGPCRVRYQATFEGERLTGTLAASGFGMADHGSWRGTRRSGPEAP